VEGVIQDRGIVTPDFDLLESKLQPPQAPAGNVARAALLDLLASSRPAPVVLITAPAGYGKTTLLSQWASRSRRSFAWVSLDEHDNDPIVLLTYIATALDRSRRLDPALFDALSTPGVSIEARVVPRLASALRSTEGSFVLVLDDVHELTNPRCIDAVDALATHIPSGSQLALSGRIQPSERIGSLRVGGRAVEVGPGELRMGQDEATELFSAAQVKLDEGKITELVERTEGWPAGLYLGALSIRGGAPADGEGLRGDDRFVADYLRSELFSRLPEDEFRFLTRTSVLKRLSAPLCDATLASRGSAAALETVERDNLFVVPLDQNRRWFRYHRLFRELLRAELERSEPEMVPELLRRASDWSATNDEPDAAVAYAQGAGDSKRVGDLVVTRAQLEYQRGRAVTVERWLDWLEEYGRLEETPLIAALGAWFSAIRGDSDRAERWTAVSERAAEVAPSEESRAQIGAWQALLRAVRGHGGVQQMQADAEFAESTFSRAGPWWLTAAAILGVMRSIAGESVAADDLLEVVTESGEAAGAWNAVSLALAERTVLAIDREDWVAAEVLAERAEAVVRSSRMEAYPPNALVFAVLARVAIHRRERARADELLTKAQRLRPQLTHVVAVVSIQARLQLAYAYTALPDPAGARTQLREADGLLRRGPDFGALAAQAEDVRSKLESARIETPGASTLTTAELRLRPLLPTQLSFREIGERLFLSRNTVKSHASSIYRKLDVTSRTAAVERAGDLGLI
jgi:LuxR family maltose regulon positive regulatory protein